MLDVSLDGSTTLRPSINFPQGVVTAIGAVVTAATGVKIF